MAGLLPPCDRILETVPALVSSTISPFTTSNVGDALEALEEFPAFPDFTIPLRGGIYVVRDCLLVTLDRQRLVAV